MQLNRGTPPSNPSASKLTQPQRKAGTCRTSRLVRAATFLKVLVELSCFQELSDRRAAALRRDGASRRVFVSSGGSWGGCGRKSRLPCAARTNRQLRHSSRLPAPLGLLPESFLQRNHSPASAHVHRGEVCTSRNTEVSFSPDCFNLSEIFLSAVPKAVKLVSSSDL